MQLYQIKQIKKSGSSLHWLILHGHCWRRQEHLFTYSYAYSISKPCKYMICLPQSYNMRENTIITYDKGMHLEPSIFSAHLMEGIYVL